MQFVEHSVNEIIEDGDIQVKINIFEGSKNLIERINIKGNTITTETVIRSTLTVDEGDPLNNIKLDKSISKLEAKDIFASVKKVVSDGSGKDLKIIDITVEEKPTGEISAGAGIGTNGGSVALEITENNWLGEGIAVSTSLDVTKESLKGGINVNNPNYNLSGNALNYHLSSTKNDKSSSGYKNTIISSGIGTVFEQYKDIYLAPALSVTMDSLTVDSTASKALKKQAGDFVDLSFLYSIVKDERDRAFMPTSGSIIRFKQVLPVYADIPSLANRFDSSLYNSFGPNIIGSLKFYAASVNGFSDDVMLSKRLHIPSSRLRGFKKGQLGPKDGVDYIGGN